MSCEGTDFISGRSALKFTFPRIDEFEDRPDSRSLQEEIEVLRLEENTWGLLQALISSVWFLCSHISISNSRTEPEKPTLLSPNPPKIFSSKTPTLQLQHSCKQFWKHPLSSPNSLSSANGCKRPPQRRPRQKPTRVTGNSPNTQLCKVYAQDILNVMVL